MTRHTYRGTELLPDRADNWRDRARCLGMDVHEADATFFPHESGSAQPAKDICARCDVRRQCLDWAIANRIEHGVFGGETAAARKRLAKAAGKDRNHTCIECGAAFTSAPTTRPKYCPTCRPIVHRRSKQMRQAARNERRRKP